MNASSSTTHADILAAWRALPTKERKGGLHGLVRWVGSVLPSTGLAVLLDLPSRYVADCLASEPVEVRRPFNGAKKTSTST